MLNAHTVLRENFQIKPFQSLKCLWRSLQTSWHYTVSQRTAGWTFLVLHVKTKKKQKINFVIIRAKQSIKQRDLIIKIIQFYSFTTLLLLEASFKVWKIFSFISIFISEGKTRLLLCNVWSDWWTCCQWSTCAYASWINAGNSQISSTLLTLIFDLVSGPSMHSALHGVNGLAPVSAMF